MDAALKTLPAVLPVLDFTTIKNELFPVVSMVFSKTNSLAIKVRGLQAFVVLCGGSTEAAVDDGLDGLATDKKTSSSSALDKYTMQEKIVPLVKAIRTKEPAVMISALNVLRIVGQIADAEFVAMEILPVLWSMSLGPLLELKQFQAFMELIKSLSRRVEDEQVRKLQETTGTSSGTTAGPNEDFLAFGGVTGTAFEPSNGTDEKDFEALIRGRVDGGGGSSGNGFMGWDETPSIASPTTCKSPSSAPQTPSFAWSTQSSASHAAGLSSRTQGQGPGFRTVTPDLSRMGTLTPSSTQFSQPLQPTQSAFQPPPRPAVPSSGSTSSSINWSSAAATASPWASTTPAPSNFVSSPNAMQAPGSSAFGGGGMAAPTAPSMSFGQRPAAGASRNSSFSLPPPPGGVVRPSNGSPGLSIRPAAQTGWNMGVAGGGMASHQAKSPLNSMSMGLGASASASAPANGQQKSGLDKYESLI